MYIIQNGALSYMLEFRLSYEYKINDLSFILICKNTNSNISGLHIYVAHLPIIVTVSVTIKYLYLYM